MTDKKKPDPEGTAETPDSPSNTVAEDAGGPLILGADEAVSEAAPNQTEDDDDPLETRAPNVSQPETSEPEDAEPVSDPIAEPVAAEPVAERVVEKRGGVGAGFLGGLVAALVVFGLSKSQVVDPLLPESWRSVDHSTELGALKDRLSQNAGALAALQGDLAALDIPDTTPIEDRIAALEARVDPLKDQIAAAAQDGASALSQLSDLSDLGTRLSELEKRPISEGVSEAAIAAYERELATLQNTMKDMRAEVEARLAEAAKTRADAEALAAEANAAEAAAAQSTTVAQIRSALDTGAPYSDLVDVLTGHGVTVPADLSAPAASGVATLTALQDAFPPAARAALAISRSEGDGGFMTFLQKQLGARSVAPKDGDSADAVLSRAEAALISGDVGTALEGIATLPPDARAAFDEWIASAAERRAAISAADDLAKTLNSK